MSVEETAAAFARVDTACKAIGRDPATLVRSCALTVCYGGDPSIVQRRAAAINRVREIAQHVLPRAAELN